MNLAQTQELFFRSLYGEPVDRSFIAGEDRLDVYARMFVCRQVDALRTDFPETAAKLGDEAFFALVERYLRAHPSEHPDLGRLGRHFAAFCPEEVRELAAVEWARAEVFLEAEAPAVSAEEFARSLRVCIIPALRLAFRTAVWRKGFEVQEVQLDAEEARALELALAGASFAEICGAFADAPAAYAALQSWIAEGWVTSPGSPA
ncbi:MAG TPA: DNA-binding domain-containing protein [Myxococcales bacterium]|nr:DNA-binding domain-containing protein [Myxococcales bacterium]